MGFDALKDFKVVYLGLPYDKKYIFGMCPANATSTEN